MYRIFIRMYTYIVILIYNDYYTCLFFLLFLYDPSKFPVLSKF